MLLLFNFLIIYSASAFEVDNVTCRFRELKDSSQAVNAEANRRIDEVIAGNGPTSAFDSVFGKSLPPSDCNEENMMEQLKGTIAQEWDGSMEDWAGNNSQLDRCDPNQGENVYSNLGFMDGRVMKIAGVNVVINMNGTKIGVDKLSHFMREGYDYYVMMKKSYGSALPQHFENFQSLKPALGIGANEESGKYGLRTTGVYSYADKMADYQGFRFWYNLFNGPNPYLKCQNGKWSKVRQFKFEDYINPGFDESVNCNRYRSETMTKSVAAYTAKIASKYNYETSSTCPLEPGLCKELVRTLKPADLSKELLHPSCQKAGGLAVSPDPSTGGGGEVTQ